MREVVNLVGKIRWLLIIYVIKENYKMESVFF